MEFHLSSAHDPFGSLADLRDAETTGLAVGSILSMLLADYDPRTEDGGRLVYLLGAALELGVTDMPELDSALRERWRQAVDRPRCAWHIEVTFDEIARIARILTSSRSRPDTQLADERSLEVLVREETPNPRLRDLRQSRDMTYSWRSGDVQFEARLGRPSLPLLFRCALRRTGMTKLHVFDGARMNAFLLATETRQRLRPGDDARVHAWRLLREAAHPGVVSLQVTAGQPRSARQLEEATTAFRARLAYESDVVLGLVQDVNRLDGQQAQPPFLRQVHVGAPVAVQAIAAWAGDGTPPRVGLPGELVYGSVGPVNEELAQRYLRALAAHDAFSAFMGYYHIIEYFMQDAWYLELSGQVPALTPPSQMPTDAALRTFTRDAARHLGVDHDDIRLTERNAIKALVRTMVDLQRVAADLDRYCAGAAHYLATSPVDFAAAEPVDLHATDPDLPVRVAERIYSVRNAITHSKASTTRYSPYTDDLQLAREVPLVRLIAEQLLVPNAARI